MSSRLQFPFCPISAPLFPYLFQFPWIQCMLPIPMGFPYIGPMGPMGIPVLCTPAANIFTARRSYASAVLGVVILSVCPSVCHTRALSLIRRTYRRYFCTTRKGNPSSFLPPNIGWWATFPSTYNRRSKWRTPSKIAHVDRFPPVTSQQQELAKKVELWRIGSRTRAFQPATECVRYLEVSQGVAQKANFSFFE